MHIVQSALYRAQQMAGLESAGARNTSGDAFSRIFGSTLDGLMRKGGIEEALKSLRERFPGISVSEGGAETGTGVGEAKTSETEKAADTDEVTVGSSVLAGMFGSAELTKMVEDAISGLLERSSDSNLMNFGGAYVQRSVTITLTQVRYGEYHRDGETGELLGAADLKANFHEQLTDLIKKFFGGDPLADKTEEDGDKTDAMSETSKTGSSGIGASVSMWSLEIYYSASYIASAFDSQSSGANANQQGAWQASAWQTSFSASLRGSLAGAIPSAMQNSGFEGGRMWQALEDTLASYGLAIGGLRQTTDGFMAKLREGRNLLAELMEMYGGRIGAPANPAADVEEEPVGDVAPTEAAEEQPVEAVAAV